MAVYEIRKSGRAWVKSTMPNCGYNAQQLKAMRAAGYELYVDGKKARSGKA